MTDKTIEELIAMKDANKENNNESPMSCLPRGWFLGKSMSDINEVRKAFGVPIKPSKNSPERGQTNTIKRFVKDSDSEHGSWKAIDLNEY